MPVARLSTVIHASPERLWSLLSDPYHMPRWWPGVRRMEDVRPDGWTQVYQTRKGRAVRADFRLVESEAPGTVEDSPGRRVWEQELPGTPFERVLAEAVTEVLLEPVDGATKVTIVERQKLRGFSRTGGFMLRRATRDRLRQALEGLEQAVDPSRR